MAAFQRASRLAFTPAGGAAAAAATTCILGGGVGRYTSATTGQKLNQAAARQLSSFAQRSFAKFPNRAANLQQRWKSAVAKEAEAVAAPAAESTSKGSKGFVEWYEGHLNARPVTTKAITGSILWGVGDVVAQVFPVVFGDSTPADESSAAVAKKEFKYDLPRTARAVFFGFALHAPLSHLHFNFLEWITVRGGFTGISIPVFKTIMEQFVYWSWFSNSLYHGAMGAMQGMNPQQIYDRIADVLWDTQVAQWSFWIPVQLLNFQFVPVRHQLNVVLLTSIAWTALLSAWYPPQEEDNEEEEKKEE